ncbi:MAG TPA: Crp/Fnr family transcriptional regulator [Blastocatellia bacterium]|nr:Crp/Fnr family transcriptional regulator [Blastocatellia bacterium]
MTEPSVPRTPTDNRLLAALPREDYERIAPHLEPVTLEPKALIHKAGDGIGHVYFPTHGMVSLILTMNDGDTVEVGVVGNEGVVSTGAFMGTGIAPNDAVVQIGGGAMRMPVKALNAEFARGGALQGVLLRYAQALYSMVSQVAACNRLHTIDARLARWLLMCQDRVRSETLDLTQELLSQMIGAERPTVTVAAMTLQEAGLISYTRGRIRILDRPGLEGAACECYWAIRKVFNHPAA